jgi:hypothetical protein
MPKPDPTRTKQLAAELATRLRELFAAAGISIDPARLAAYARHVVHDASDAERRAERERLRQIHAQLSALAAKIQES